MSPASVPVLGSALVVTSPAFYAVLEGTLPLDVALTRLLIAVPLCWAALNVVAGMVLSGGRPPAAATPKAPPASEQEPPDRLAG